MAKIYGIDTEGKVTPLMVRDAMGECFYEAHCEQAELGGEEMNRQYCHTIVKKAFEDSGGDYDRPTKESIIRAMGQLQEFAKNFRDKDIIARHTREIVKLVNKLQDNG